MKMAIKKPAPPAPRPEGFDQTMGLPRPVGSIIGLDKNIKLTVAEKKTLKDMGWQEGQPVPSDAATMAEQIRQAIEADTEARTEKLLGEWSSKQPLEPPEVVDIEQLSPEQRKIVEQTMQEAIKIQTENAKKPSTGGLFGKKIVNDKQPPKVQFKPEVKEQPPSPPVPPVDAGSVLPALCPHCGWDQTKDDPTTPSVEEKRAFLVTPSGGRFLKKVSLYEGGVIVVFRMLTSVESEKCWAQASKDVKDGKVFGVTGVYDNLANYRLVCSLHSVIIDGQLLEIPEYTEFDKEGMTLPDMVDRIKEEILTTESLWRVVGYSFGKFQRLTEKLETGALDPNF